MRFVVVVPFWVFLLGVAVGGYVLLIALGLAVIAGLIGAFLKYPKQILLLLFLGLIVGLLSLVWKPLLIGSLLLFAIALLITPDLKPATALEGTGKQIDAESWRERRCPSCYSHLANASKDKLLGYRCANCNQRITI